MYSAVFRLRLSKCYVFIYRDKTSSASSMRAVKILRPENFQRKRRKKHICREKRFGDGKDYFSFFKFKKIVNTLNSDIAIKFITFKFQKIVNALNSDVAIKFITFITFFWVHILSGNICSYIEFLFLLIRLSLYVFRIFRIPIITMLKIQFFCLIGHTTITRERGTNQVVRRV